MSKIERWVIQFSAPLNDKIGLLSEVRDWVDMSGVTLVTIWEGLEPSLLLIEKIMVEYEENVADPTLADPGEPSGGTTG